MGWILGIILFLITYHWATSMKESETSQKEACAGLHNWQYNAYGRLQCLNCKRFPGEINYGDDDEPFY